VLEIDGSKGSADDETVVRFCVQTRSDVGSRGLHFFMGLLEKAACINLSILQAILDMATRRLRRTKDHVHQNE
jgi:hypothetical protein